METSAFTGVETVETYKAGASDHKISRKFLLRQVFVCSGIWISYFCCGLSFGAPTVLIPQIRQEANSSDAVSMEMASWLSSAMNYSGLVSSVVLAILVKQIGRKLTFVCLSGAAIIGFILLYFSTTLLKILIGLMIHGPLMAGPLTVSIMVLTEYVSPRYRGVFLTLKSAVFLWGIWVANAIGTFVHWKNIAILGLICSTYSLLTCLFWPESPYWLANKNRLEDCTASHRWLKGLSEESQAELEKIIQSRKVVKSASVNSLNFSKKIFKMFKCKSFYKPIFLSMSVESLYHFSGKIACAMYAIDIIKRITGSEATAYTGMLILDGITILGMYVGCGLSKIVKRKSLLLISSTIGVTFLFAIAFYLYLIHLEIISENTKVSLLLLMGYSLAISVGPMIMASTIIGELIPVKYRSSSALFLACFSNFLMGSIVKISPFILNYVGVRGLFLLFAVSTALFTLINYKVLPETKDKTILEIQESLLVKQGNIFCELEPI